MIALRVLLSRLTGRGRTPAELDAEFTAHQELLAADLEREGLSAAAARRAKHGDGWATSPRLQEAYREQRRLPFLEPFAQDLGYAFRQLRRSPGFAAAAVLTLALGIGANVAIYQALDAVLFRELPVRHPEQLVQVQFLENGSPIHVSYPSVPRLLAQQQVLDGVFAVSDFPAARSGAARPGRLARCERIAGQRRLLSPVGCGRANRPHAAAEDDRAGAPPVAVLSDAFWAREFDRSPAALGQPLRINNATATVDRSCAARVLRRDRRQCARCVAAHRLQPQLMPGDWLNAPSSSWLTVMGRLRPGVSRPRPDRAGHAVSPAHRVHHHPARQKLHARSSRRIEASWNCRRASSSRCGYCRASRYSRS